MGAAPTTKNLVLRCVLSFCGTKITFFETVVTCDEKRIFYDNQRRSVHWLDRNDVPQHFPKRNLHQKMVMVIVWWSAAKRIHHNLLNPGETITAVRKLRKCTVNFVNNNQRWSIEIGQFFSMTMPGRTSHNWLYKVQWIGLPASASQYLQDLSPADYHFFKHLDNFLRDKREERISFDFSTRVSKNWSIGLILKWLIDLGSVITSYTTVQSRIDH